MTPRGAGARHGKHLRGKSPQRERGKPRRRGGDARPGGLRLPHRRNRSLPSRDSRLGHDRASARSCREAGPDKSYRAYEECSCRLGRLLANCRRPASCCKQVGETLASLGRHRIPSFLASCRSLAGSFSIPG